MIRAHTTIGCTDREIRNTLREPLPALDADAECELRREDFVADMPQSAERVRGRDAMRELQLAFPPNSKPTFTVRRITGSGELWTVEAEGDYGGQIFRAHCVWRSMTSTPHTDAVRRRDRTAPPQRCRYVMVAKDV